MASFVAKPSRVTSASKLGIAKDRHSHGFTLVELLTAMVVLSLLVVMTSSLVNSASVTVANSSKRLGADDEVRMVFDRMQMDFARMLKRGDVWFQFSKQTGNDQFTFYSETPGFSTASADDQSNLSLVTYYINNSNQLVRGSEGYQWTNIVFSPNPNPVPSVPSTDVHVLSNSIFRMEIGFLVRQNDTSVQITSTAPTPGSQAFQNFYAVIVALGVLDSSSQKLVSATCYPTLINALTDYTGSETIALNAGSSSPDSATTDPILSSWRSTVDSPSFAQTVGIPKPAAQQVRIYQRIFYLQ